MLKKLKLKIKLKMIEEIDWSNYPNGTKIKVKIKGTDCEGRIFRRSGHIYVCQNELKGFNVDQTLGYKHAYNLGNAGANHLRIQEVDRDSIKLTLDDKFNIADYKIKFSVKDGYIYKGSRGFIGFNQSPFHNCQNLSILSYCNIAAADANDLEETFAKLAQVKAFSVIDIQTCYVQYLPDDKCILFKAEYTSTNGSEMCIVGLDNKKTSNYFKRKQNEK